MKIAFILREFPVISETFILNQMTGLLDHGHDVTIYAEVPRGESTIHPAVCKYELLAKTHYWRPPKNRFLRVLQALYIFFALIWKHPSAIFSAVNITRFGKEASSLRLLYKVASLLRKGEPYDVVQCHFGYNGNLACTLKEIGAIQGKIVTTFHGIDITKQVKAAGPDLYSDLFANGDAFLAISQKWKDKLIALGCSPEKTHLHRLGINTDQFVYCTKILASNQKTELLSIARLVEKKGIEYSIRAVTQLTNQYPNLHYKIIGDGPLRKSLEHLIKELKADNNIQILGWKHHEDVLSLIHQCDAVLAPSVTSSDGDQEGIPVTLMEAMAIGRPIISTWHSGIPELVQDGVTGFLVPERDVKALSLKIEALINSPADKYEHMCQKGRQFIEENYDLHQSNKRLMNLYQDLLSKPEISTSVPSST